MILNKPYAGDRAPGCVINSGVVEMSEWPRIDLPRCAGRRRFQPCGWRRNGAACEVSPAPERTTRLGAICADALARQPGASDTMKSKGRSCSRDRGRSSLLHFASLRPALAAIFARYSVRATCADFPSGTTRFLVAFARGPACIRNRAFKDPLLSLAIGRFPKLATLPHRKLRAWRWSRVPARRNSWHCAERSCASASGAAQRRFHFVTSQRLRQNLPLFFSGLDVQARDRDIIFSIRSRYR